MEKERYLFSPPRGVFTIGGTQLNIRAHLDGLQTTPHYWLDKMKPGDDEARDLIRTLKCWNVTSNEYFTAMLRLLELAAKEGGGFDADFIDVTKYFMKKVISRRGGFGKVIYGNEIARVAYFADVYGQLQAVKDGIWNDPDMTIAKQQLLTLAKKYRERRFSSY